MRNIKEYPKAKVSFLFDLKVGPSKKCLSNYEKIVLRYFDLNNGF